jgi:NMD protein affecting ribosome stability and mRNA decay
MIYEDNIYATCKECVNNPLGNISVAHQIACCVCNECLLYHERPIWVMEITQPMMEYLEVSTDLLCERARPLVEPAPSHSVDDQIERLLAEIEMKSLLTKGDP